MRQQVAAAPAAAAVPVRVQRARAVRPLRAAEPGRQPVSASAAAAAPVAPVAEEAPATVFPTPVDYEALAHELEGASPLEIMDRALAMFGSEIAIAFRCVTHSSPVSDHVSRARLRPLPVGLQWTGFSRAVLVRECSRHPGIFRACGWGDS